MWSGCRAVGIVGSVLSLGGCVSDTPAARAAAQSSSPSDEPSGARSVRVEVSSAGTSVGGEKVGTGPEALKAALLLAGAGALDVQATTDAPAALVLAALTLDAGPHVARRSLSWQDVKLEVSEPHAMTRGTFGDPIPAAIFSWHANRATQLWSISAGPTLANFGPFEPGDRDAEPAVISSLTKVCAPTGCGFVVELRAERLLEALRSWQRIFRAVRPRFGLQVSEQRLEPPNPERREVGRLPPELIQSVVRIGFGRVRACYEEGLGREPKLEGRVTVRFIIERDGTVKDASDGGSDLPDTAVRDCLIHQFLDFKFPAPESGIITVVYPIALAPD